MEAELGSHNNGRENGIKSFSSLELDLDGNPYQALIRLGHDQPAEIQSIYSIHRTKRNARQREEFLSRDYKELVIDPVLLRLENPDIEPGFQDPRNCFVFWARPPDHIIKLALHLQSLLKKAAPDLWLMPSHRMHLTTMEVTHSRAAGEIADLVSVMRPAIPALTNFTYAHRSRLVKPFLSYDLSAIAVSFLPATDEPVLLHTPPPSASGNGESIAVEDRYTYHHLRRDVFDLVQATGVEIGSRYVLPSAHITLARYLTQKDHDTPAKRRAWICAIDVINRWLETEVWDNPECGFTGEWVVGQERGLDARVGTLWYGGGRTLMVGEGF